MTVTFEFVKKKETHKQLKTFNSVIIWQFMLPFYWAFYILKREVKLIWPYASFLSFTST